MTNLESVLLPVSAGKAKTRHGRLGLIVMVLALQCAPAFAVELDAVAKSNVASSPQADVAWLSGGIGDEAMAEMHKASSAYNVHVMLTGPQGNYLAGVPFSVTRQNGQVAVAGVTDGPLLYLKLPTGRYQMAVQLDGSWQTRPLQVSGSGKVTKQRFIAKGE
jgi:hypothetical protein